MIWKRRTVPAVLAIVLLNLIWSGIGMAQAQRADGVVPPPEAPKVTPSTADGSSSVGVGVDNNTFLLGPGDILGVEVWRQPNYSQSVMVAPDGKITLNPIGDLQAAGLSPAKLGAQIKEALLETIKDPMVTVRVLQVNSQKYTISGEVLRVGSFPLTAPTRVFDALNNAGGFKDFANKKDIVVVRGNQALHFNYQDHLRNPAKNPEKNVFLQNGDQIIVK